MKPNPEIRFLRFECDQYYPGGWSNDLTGTFATLEEALREPSRNDYAEVYDTWTGETHEIARDTRPLPKSNDPISKMIDATLPGLLARSAEQAAAAAASYDGIAGWFGKPKARRAAKRTKKG